MSRGLCAAHLAAAIAGALLAVGAALAQTDDELAQALRSIEDLTLLRTLELDERQLEQFIPAVEGIAQLLASQQQQQDAALEAAAEAFRQAREALLLGRPMPPETVRALERAAADEESRAAKHQSQLDAQIDAVRDLLHPRQIALIDWRTEEEREETTVRPPDPEQAAFFGIALSAMDRVRMLDSYHYWQRLDMAGELLATFVPPGSPEFRTRYPRILDILDRAMRTPPEQYAVARVALAEELLRTVGALAEVSRAEPPITREALVRALTRPGTVELLREMLQAQQARPKRR